MNGRYPSEPELKYIREWTDGDDPMKLLAFLQEIWNYEDYIIVKGKKKIRLELHTGGWSGNEDIIEALKESNFWWRYWQGSRRGGHYEFKVNL